MIIVHKAGCFSSRSFDMWTTLERTMTKPKDVKETRRQTECFRKRKESLFRKCFELNALFDTDVYLVTRRRGRCHVFRTRARAWPPAQEDLVWRHEILFADAKYKKDEYYPQPVVTSPSDVRHKGYDRDVTQKTVPQVTQQSQDTEPSIYACSEAPQECDSTTDPSPPQQNDDIVPV